jgi:hypothetical protein
LSSSNENEISCFAELLLSSTEGGNYTNGSMESVGSINAFNVD